MTQAIRGLLTMGLVFVMSSCASESCHEIRRKEMSIKSGTVRVYQYDGSLQCGMGDEVSLEKMSKQLDDIPIVSMEKAHDGLMRTQVCGTPTGMANVYEISRDDLERAKKMGFDEWIPDKLKRESGNDAAETPQKKSKDPGLPDK